MKKNLGLGVVALLASFLFVASAWSVEITPDRLVEETVKEVLEIIENDEDIKGADKERILDLVESKILPHFNFTRMTQLAMGRHWSKAETSQQTVLVDEFRTLLVRTYSNALSSYRDEIVQVHQIKNLGDREDVTVRTVIIQGSGKQPVPIDYSMEKKSDGWKVYDVTVAGVSLVTNYRSSFTSQIRRGGVDGLIKTLVDRNKALEGK